MPSNHIDPVGLSKYIINKVNEYGYEVSHLKLQKLLYYCDAWHMVYFDGSPLIRENFQAWMHGPVVREVWDYYKDESVLNGILEPKPLKFDINEILSSEQLEVIDDVLEEYGQRSPYYLECLTHDEKPWKDARKGIASCDRSDKAISKGTMKSFYREMLYGEEAE